MYVGILEFLRNLLLYGWGSSNREYEILETNLPHKGEESSIIPQLPHTSTLQYCAVVYEIITTSRHPSITAKDQRNSYRKNGTGSEGTNKTDSRRNWKPSAEAG